jgi:hypothetical protein
LGYVEFLSRLVQDEVERRAQKQLALRLRRGQINPTKTLETFDFGGLSHNLGHGGPSGKAVASVTTRSGCPKL